MTRGNMESEVDLKFKDWVEQINDGLGKEQWIVAYSSNETKFELATFYSALIPPEDKYLLAEYGCLMAP